MGHVFNVQVALYNYTAWAIYFAASLIFIMYCSATDGFTSQNQVALNKLHIEYFRFCPPLFELLSFIL